MRRPSSATVLSGVLAVAGLLHFAKPRFYEPMIPDALPGSAGLWVAGSGVVELACAAAVAAPRTRRVGAYATALLFLAVWPGNWLMALESGDRDAAYRAVVWARLPLQVPLVVWAVRVARRARSVGEP